MIASEASIRMFLGIGVAPPVLDATPMYALGGFTAKRSDGATQQSPGFLVEAERSGSDNHRRMSGSDPGRPFVTVHLTAGPVLTQAVVGGRPLWRRTRRTSNPFSATDPLVSRAVGR